MTASAPATGYEWRSVIPYAGLVSRRRSTRIEPPHLIEADAHGELRGTGRWRFFGERETTRHIRVERQDDEALDERRIAPLARPIFRWNHNVVMHQGGEGFAALLGAKLLAVT